MVTVYKDLVESFGYTPVMEAVSLDTIMAAVGNDKDEQSRAAKLNDIAWKENLPGLYDPVSGNFVRKQSMPARSGGRYDIAATASSSADKELADRGLVPDNASTSTAIGRMVRGDDKKQYDQDIRSRSQAARGEKPPGQGGQPTADSDTPPNNDTSSYTGDRRSTLPSTDSKPLGDIDIGFGPNQFTPNNNKPSDNKPLGDIDIGFGPNQFTPSDNKPSPNKPTPNSQVTIPGQGGDMDAKRKKYAELLAKAKNSTVPSGSRM